MRNLTKDEISVKVKQITEKGCLLLLYKTARVDAQILDEEFGPHNWVNDYKEIKGNLFCGIGVRQDNGDFIWRWDCGVESATEAEKGEASDAFKRAGFKWGIGVELYTAPFIWANVETVPNKKGGYDLKNKFMKFKVTDFEVKDGKIIKLVITDDKGCVVYPAQKTEPKPEKSDFAKMATAEKTANTKSVRKAIKEGETELPKKERSEDELKERFSRTMQFLVNVESMDKLSNSQIDFINNLCVELFEAGFKEQHQMLCDLYNKLQQEQLNDNANL